MYFRPVGVDQLIFMSLIHRSAWYKIHGLNQDAADVVGNHEIRQPLPYALYVIVSAYDKQSPHAQAMALDILYRRTISA